MRADIRKRLKSCSQALAALGPNRDTKDQQYKYLLELTTRFQGITSHALMPYYGGDDVFDSSPSRKLATAIVHRNVSFSNDVWENGPTMKFSEEVGFNKTATSQEDAEDSDDGAEYLRVRYPVNHRELDDLMQDDSKVAPPKEIGIKSWLADVYIKGSSWVFSTQRIVRKKQSENWDALALAYINDVVSIVHSFIVHLLSKICKDERIRRGLSSVILEELMERYKKGIDHTRYLLAVERSDTPLTTNHYFADNLKKMVSYDSIDWSTI